MYQNTTSLKVNEFLNGENQRINKINGKIEIIDSKIQKAKEQINLLEDECVNCDLDENISGKEKAEQSITSLRRDLENIEGQRSAFERLKCNDKGAIAKALKVQKEAAKEVSKVTSLFFGKIEESKKLEEEIKIIEKKIKDIGCEIEILRREPNSIADEVIKIEKYIYEKGIFEKRCNTNKIEHSDKQISVLADLRNL